MRNPPRIRIKKINRKLPLRFRSRPLHNSPNSCSIRFTTSFITLIRAYHL